MNQATEKDGSEEKVFAEHTHEGEEVLASEGGRTEEKAAPINCQAKEKEEDFKAKYYYLAAEMENARKRFEREKDNWIKYGNERILSSLLEVVDNLDLTLSAIDKDADSKVKNIAVGIEMVRKQFLEVLSSNGLTPVESLGKVFDPNFHEAMGQQAAEGKKENEVLFEYKKGYVLNGRLLRAAKVVVAKKAE